MTEQIEHIAVIGAGYMGGGIAQVFAMAGLDVVICDADPALTHRQLDRLRREAEEFEQQGLFDPGSADLVQKNLRAADTLVEAVAEADLVEEAVLERPDVKGPVLRSIEEAARPDAVIGSNTSTLPIGDLAAGLEHGERFLGVHFSNPAPFIPGVELIAHAGTDEAVVQAVEALVPSNRQADGTGQRQGRLRAQSAAVRAAQGGHQPRRGGGGHAGGRGHHRPHHVRLPAAVLRSLRDRRHGRPRRLP